MHPSAVVERQQRLRAAQLELRHVALQKRDGASDELRRGERIQLLLPQQVVDADGRVAVVHVEAAACRRHQRRHESDGPADEVSESLPIRRLKV